MQSTMFRDSRFVGRAKSYSMTLGKYFTRHLFNSNSLAGVVLVEVCTLLSDILVHILSTEMYRICLGHLIETRKECIVLTRLVHR